MATGGGISTFAQPAQVPMNAGMGQNQNLVGQMMMDPLEVSASAVDQLVQFEIENIEDEYEEMKI